MKKYKSTYYIYKITKIEVLTHKIQNLIWIDINHTYSFYLFLLKKARSWNSPIFSEKYYETVFKTSMHWHFNKKKKFKTKSISFSDLKIEHFVFKLTLNIFLHDHGQMTCDVWREMATREVHIMIY